MRANACILAVMLGLWGCGPDLGTCPPDYQMQLVNGVHPGQTLINGSCASGRCHSRAAAGINRVGAPAGLNFDMTALDPVSGMAVVDTAGVANALEWADHMWGEVEGGTMPPGAPLDAASQESVRAFLACGVSAQVPMGGVSQDMFSSMVVPALTLTCLGCHDPNTAANGGNFVLGTADNACTMYNALVNRPSLCAPTSLLVSPGMPDASVLVGKLDNGPALCGSLMPLGALPTSTFATTQPAVYQALRQWITMGAPKPAGCP